MNLKEEFSSAMENVRTLPEKPNNKILLLLYGLKKQATEGDINIDRPDVFDFVGQAKYDAWERQKGRSEKEVMEEYINLVKELLAKSQNS